MRPDVKLGVVTSFVVVIVAGGYYLYRDSRETPIPVAGLSESSSKLAAKSQKSPPAARSNGPRAKSRSSSAADQRRAPSPRATPGRKPEVKGTGSSSTPSKHGRSATPRRQPSDARGKSADRSAKARPRAGKGVANSDGKKSSTRVRPNGKQAAKRDRGKDGPGPSQATGGKRASSTTDPSGRRQGQPGRPSSGKIPPVSSTPEPAAAPVEVARPASPGPAVDTHRVQPGDTFASLAESYYGHERHTQFLVDSNPEISNPRTLRAGTVIKIPPLTHQATPGTQKHSNAVAAKASGDDRRRRTYKVSAGDTFYIIAREVLGDATRWQEVFALNKELVNGDPRRLQIGQVLILP